MHVHVCACVCMCVGEAGGTLEHLSRSRRQHGDLTSATQPGPHGTQALEPAPPQTQHPPLTGWATQGITSYLLAQPFHLKRQGAASTL